MFAKIKEIEERYDALERDLGNPDIINNQQVYQKYLKEHSTLSPIVETFRRYKAIQEEIEGNKSLLDDPDPEIRKLAKEEIDSLRQTLEQLERELKILLLPKDPNDEKNILLEIRAGTGGEEAALFAADLFRMYSRYAESKGWKTEIMSQHPTGIGGFKEIIILIEGKKVYSRLKFEGGVHRVQRVPETEAQGRIHTSAVTVAILPEAEEIDVQIDPEDLRIDVYRASGHGGQHVNTTDSAVRITHLPTGLVVTCQDEKSQHKNKAKAMKVLRSRLYELQQAEQHSKISEERRNMVGSGDRSERIRTYNFPQGRVTDHRIGLTLYKLEDILQGNLDMIIDPLITHFQTEALKQAAYH
ncbi:MAG: peptide chain release factor 1 [Deltaproteobacteria bacterium]|nr:peptide chain release factor 1 [Deltaproteobacteria bacterium]MBW1928647.1 peptide chain release factor 1 [Deltaproteobacteria bacterium]MBW2026834.1 peptide chain release factor 1 [Deltaproteobacteria bacterium]MBW2126850.1 peptide chain release factor 1 [Deltaproteobacteria bacterium]RLB19125.1 MAG: peptide chain release factor 1 [Deltaproteobacteria bacterium]